MKYPPESIGTFSLSVQTYAYVTYQDIRKIKSLQDQTVIAVKAPSETKLEVPDPKEVKKKMLPLFSVIIYQLYTQSDYTVQTPRCFV